MNIDTVVCCGHAPWHPSAFAVPGEVLHFHDIPLIGVFSYGNQAYAFMCMSGDTSNLNVWAYIPLSGEDVEVLASEKLQSLEDLQRYLGTGSGGRDVVFALALNNKITRWQPRNVADDLLVDVIAFLTDARASMAEYTAKHAALPTESAAQRGLDDLVDSVSRFVTT